jgi:hypothetical protein
MATMNVAIKLHIQEGGEGKRRLAELREDNVNGTRSWFGLIRLCATPALVVAVGCAILFTSAVVAFAVAGGGEPVEAAAQETHKPGERMFAGLVTDDHCGARHSMDSGMSPTECTRMCVRNGSRYILVEGDKKYALAGGESKLDGLAGQRAKIAGTLAGTTIKVASTSSRP